MVGSEQHVELAAQVVFEGLLVYRWVFEGVETSLESWHVGGRALIQRSIYVRIQVNQLSLHVVYAHLAELLFKPVCEINFNSETLHKV